MGGVWMGVSAGCISQVICRYFLRFTIARSFAANITKELDIWVHNYQKLPEINNSIKMEVGIEDCLHIEFEYNRSKYVSLSSFKQHLHHHSFSNNTNHSNRMN